MRKMEIGAPALQGNERKTVKDVFGDAEFPIMARVTNHMPCDITLPEIGGLELLHVCNSEGRNSKEVMIDDIDRLTRAVSSMEQIAGLSRVRHALTIEVVSAEGDEGEGDNPEDQNPGPDGGSAGGENTGGQSADDDQNGKQDKSGGGDDQNSQQPEANKSGAGATKTAAKSGSSGSKAKKGD
ncbi:hypothetical protein [Nitrosomonas marina]|uniref:Uncharacterized protein n=1 Tax=Nitrosomonas marina TaxID=917 RepID=A0A1H8IQG8_9PROT|nr:hypothetical protein [Nitrosomonas marina]SEN69918.1 hypothetical protein SAMN05216325_13614 [Nitrosomonas marina]